jgi:hypothetical protein
VLAKIDVRVRAALLPIIRLGQKYGVPIIGARHLAKDDQRKAIRYDKNDRVLDTLSAY